MLPGQHKVNTDRHASLHATAQNRPFICYTRGKWVVEKAWSCTTGWTLLASNTVNPTVWTTKLSLVEFVFHILCCDLNLAALAPESWTWTLSCFLAMLTVDNNFQNYLEDFLAICLLTYFQLVKQCANIQSLSIVFWHYTSSEAYWGLAFSNILQRFICSNQTPSISSFC